MEVVAETDLVLAVEEAEEVARESLQIFGAVGLWVVIVTVIF